MGPAAFTTALRWPQRSPSSAMAASTEAPSKQVGGEADGIGRPEVGERRRGLVEVVTGAGQHGDTGAVGGEAVGGRPTHAGGAAGDDDGGSGESEVHVMRSCGCRVVRSGDRLRPWP